MARGKPFGKGPHNIAYTNPAVREARAETLSRTINNEFVAQGKRWGNKRIGEDPVPPTETYVVNEAGETMIFLRARGLSFRKIADASGFSKSAIQRFCTRPANAERIKREQRLRISK